MVKKAEHARYGSIEEMIVAASQSVRPPKRMTVSEAATDFRYLNNPGSYVGPWKHDKTPYLVEPMDTLTSLDYTGMVFVGPARTGKALALDTPIPTPTGWTSMGDLQIGDEVFTPYGDICKVFAATEVMHGRPCYEIEFSSGEKIVCDAEHQWFVRDVIREKSRTVTADEIFKSHGRQKRNRFAIRNTFPIGTPAKDLPIDPYILGVWLGDGNSRNGYVTSHENDATELLSQIEKRGYSATVYAPRHGTKSCVLAIRGPDGVSLENYLRSVKVGSEYGKHIPPEYLRASVEQRRELLRGLADTDGSMYGRNGRAVQICSSFPRLAQGITELVRTLGYRPRPRSRETWYKKNGARKRCLDSHKIEFTTYEPENVFTFKRKIDVIKRGADTAERKSQVNSRFIVAIKPVDSVPVRCIQVDDAFGMFLCGEGMIPTHNSDMFFNWLTYTAICDPADMLLVHMTQTTARDWSQGDLRKVFRHSPALGEKVTPGRQNMNTYDVKFLSGMRLLVKWPTISELSGKTLPRVFLNDYDRGDEVIEKEGIKWDLASKRTTTYKRHAMTVAESSPGRDVLDSSWLQTSPHEAPPTGDKDKPGGILALYNRGDRRRWQWRCPHCEETFEPDTEHLSYPDLPDIAEAAEQTVMICPNNGCILQPSDQYELNRNGRWVKEGMKWMPDGSMEGTPRRTKIASFWLKGVAAAFTDWKSLVVKLLTAQREFDATGNEQALRSTITLDQGNAYVPKALTAMRLPESLKARREDWGGTKDKPVVPVGTRFLIATVDVQARAFVVQVTGFGYGGDLWVVDMFKIRKSARLDHEGHPLPVDPAAYVEDWDLLIEQVMNKTYPLADGTGRRMQIKMTGCDSGGKEGVTANAYNFYRKLRKHPEGIAARFRLVKGEASKTAPRVRETLPDSNQKGFAAIARGDVPVFLLNTNLLKDQVSAMLGRGDPGIEQSGGMIHFPMWAEDWFYKLLCTEIRTSKGWENKSGSRNEAFDLTVYAVGLGIYPPINFEKINWDRPPSWAEEWDNNDLVSLDTITKRFTNQHKGVYDLSALGEDLA